MPGLQLAAGLMFRPGDVRAFAGKDLGLFAGFQESRGGEHRARVAAARDDLLVIGKVPSISWETSSTSLQAEDHLAAAGRQHHLQRLVAIA